MVYTKTPRNNSYTVASHAKEVIDFLHCLNPKLDQLTIRNLIGDFLDKKINLPYHNNDHVFDMYKMYETNHKTNMGNPIVSYYIPLLAILFHDQICVAGNTDNEEASCEALMEFLSALNINATDTSLILDRAIPLIMYTKTHDLLPSYAPAYARLFMECDLVILGADNDNYINYAKSIRSEYSYCSNGEYRKGRLSFLNKMKSYYFQQLSFLNEQFQKNLDWEIDNLLGDSDLILSEIELYIPRIVQLPKQCMRWEQAALTFLNDPYLECPPVYSQCIYAGSFMPITNGHLHIANKATKIFDNVLILIADNPKKTAQITQNIRKILVALECLKYPRITVDTTTGYVAKYAEQINCNTLIRGLRPIGDFEGELQLAMANKAINPNLETIFIPCNIEDSYVSSSLVRELAMLGKGKEFVPSYVNRYLEQQL